MLVIDDSTSNDILFRFRDPDTGNVVGRGHEPEQYDPLLLRPPEVGEAPEEMDLIPESEWDARYDEMEEQKSSLLDIRGNIPSLSQGSYGYCWSHSVTHVLMIMRAVANMPYIPLSAFMIAADIKNGANQGGWCGLAAEYAREKGTCSQAFWAQGDANVRNHRRPEEYANALLHRIDEEWRDLQKQPWGQEMTFKQVMTCLFRRQACALDFNWWGHSVCGLKPVRIERGSWGIGIWNSWGDSWGERGIAALRGSKALPDGAISVRSVFASAI